MERVAAFFIIMKMRHRSNVVHGVRTPHPSHSFLHPRLQCPNLSLIPRPTSHSVLLAKLSVKPNQRAALLANSATNTRFSSSLVSRHRSRSSNKNSKTGLPVFHLERQANFPLLRSVHGPTWQTQPKTNRCLRKSHCKSLRKNHCKSQRKSQCRSQRKSQRNNPG